MNDGVLTGAGAGNATVIAVTVDGGKTAVCSVTVKPKEIAVESVSLDKTTLELHVGESATLIASIAPENATNKKVEWSSSDEEVATVSNGDVVAAKAGSTIITAKTCDGEKTAVCSVSVPSRNVPVESVSLEKTSVEMKVGEIVQFTVSVTPEYATDSSIFWLSSDPDVATVENGLVTLVSKGCSIISATNLASGRSAKCYVYVLSTCQEALDGENDHLYALEGVCENIYNQKYWNWYLKDGTGRIHIYGTVDLDGNFAKDYGFEEGDIVRVCGPRGTYGDIIQLVNAYCISVKKQ